MLRNISCELTQDRVKSYFTVATPRRGLDELVKEFDVSTSFYVLPSDQFGHGSGTKHGCSTQCSTLWFFQRRRDSFCVVSIIFVGGS
jgi:hypothetical protein